MGPLLYHIKEVMFYTLERKGRQCDAGVSRLALIFRALLDETQAQRRIATYTRTIRNSEYRKSTYGISVVHDVPYFFPRGDRAPWNLKPPISVNQHEVIFSQASVFPLCLGSVLPGTGFFF